MEIEILEFNSWFNSRLEELERQVTRTISNFRSYFQALQLDAAKVFVAREVGLEVPARGVSIKAIQMLLRRGVNLRGSGLGERQAMTYVFHVRRMGRPVSPVGGRDGGTSSSLLPKLYSLLEKVGLSEGIVSGYVERELQFGVSERALPLTRGHAYRGRVEFDLSARKFRIAFEGQVAVDFFRKAPPPPQGEWRLEWDDLSQPGPGDDSSAAQKKEEVFEMELFRKEPIEAEELKAEIERLEQQHYNMGFYNIWDLAECTFKRGVAYLRLAQVEPDMELVRKARDAFKFVLNTDYRTSESREAFLKRAIHLCEHCEWLGEMPRQSGAAVAPTGDDLTRFLSVGAGSLEALVEEKNDLEFQLYTGTFLNAWDLAQCRYELATTYLKLARETGNSDLAEKAKELLQQVSASQFRTAECTDEHLHCLHRECELCHHKHQSVAVDGRTSRS
ncbi:MAG: hypothetical protein ACTSU5_20775 [Promethearchaeota archaeon]